MKQHLRLFLKNERAATAAEFSLVLPLALIFMLGMIDVGRFMWTVNRAEKATQMGTRFAVVTAPVPSGIVDYSFTPTIDIGENVPASAYGTATCGFTPSVPAKATDTASCTCTTGICPWPVGANNDAFTKVYDRMKLFLPEVGKQHIKIDYSPSGLGYAGDPTGSDIYPVVTVRLQGFTFKPITTLLFNISTPTPTVSTSLTMEDAVGSASN